MDVIDWKGAYNTNHFKCNSGCGAPDVGPSEDGCIKLTKSCDPAGPYALGEEVTFTFEVENCGNVDITGIMIEDNTATVSGGPIDLPAGAVDTATFTATYTVTEADVAAGGFTNGATVSGAVLIEGVEELVEAADTHDVTTIAALMSCIKVVKSCDPTGPFQLDDEVTFTFDVINCGETDLTGVAVVDPTATVVGGPIDIAAGTNDATSITATYIITQADVDAGEVVNVASATGINPDGDKVVSNPDDPDASHTVTTIAAGMPCIKLVKSCDPAGPFQLDDVVTFTFDVINCGDVDLTNVTVTDDIAVVSGGPIDLLAGANDATTITAAYTITQADVDAGSVTNTASASGIDPDGVLVESDASDPDATHVVTTEEVVTNPCIKLVKSCDPAGPYVVDDVVTFTFDLINCGDVDLTDVSVTDDKGNVVGGPVDIAVGANDATSITATYTITQADADAGTVVNTASATAAAPDGVLIVSDPDDADSTHTVVVNTVPEPCLKVIKSCDPAGPYQLDQEVTFTFDIQNCGDADITGITVIDDMAALTGGPIDLAAGANDATTITGTYTITQADVDNGSVTNSATVQGTGPNGLVISDPNDPDATHVVTTEEVLDCEVIVEDVLTAETLETCPTGETIREFTTEEVGAFQDGYGPFYGDASELTNINAGNGCWTVPVPAVPAGCVLLLHVAASMQDTSGTYDSAPAGYNGSSGLGPVTITDPTNGADTSAQTLLWEDLQNTAGYTSHLWAFDQITANSGGTIDVCLLSPLYGIEYGAVMGVWTAVCATDGLPVTTAEVDIANSYQFDMGLNANGEAATTSEELMTDPDCPTLLFGWGRHVFYDGTATGQYLNPTDWVVPSAGSEIYDYASWVDENELRFCQVGLSLDTIPAGTTYTVDANGNLAVDAQFFIDRGLDPWSEWAKFLAIPLLCKSAGEPCDPVLTSTPLELTITPVCDGDYTKTVTMDVEFTVADGDTVSLVPVIDGTADPIQAVTASASGTQSITVMVFGTATAGVDVVCTLGFEMTTDAASTGTAGSSIAIPAGTVTITAS